MAEKKITDLTLRDNVSAEVNFPSDDGIQSYRVTAAQVKDFVLPDEGVTRAKIIEAERIPVGTIFPFAGGTIPAGYLICQGAAVNRTTYAALFAVIGITHGQGDGSTTFNLPDYRGRFLRGRANGSANDPDRATRTAMATGGNTGDNVGSVQGHAFQTHTHTQNQHTHTQNSHSHNINVYGGAGSPGANWVGNVFQQTRPTTGTTATNQNTTATNQNASATGGTSQASSNETRPINAYANFIIKF